MNHRFVRLEEPGEVRLGEGGFSLVLEMVRQLMLERQLHNGSAERSASRASHIPQNVAGTDGDSLISGCDLSSDGVDGVLEKRYQCRNRP